MQLSLSAKAYSLVAVPLLFELAFVSVLVFFQGQLEQSFHKEIQARRLANQINQALADCIKAGTYAMLYQFEPDKSLLRTGRKKIHDLYRVRDNLIAMEGLSKVDRHAVKELGADIDSILHNFPDPDNPVTRKDKSYLLSLNLVVEDLLDKADQILDRQNIIQKEERDEQERLRSFITSAVVAVVVFNVVLALMLAGMFNRSIVKRLNVVLENANRLSSGKSLLPNVAGQDEVANLDLVFHDMAEKIEKAMEREKALIANSSDVIFAIDSLLEIKLMSSASQRLWGYEPQDLIGQAVDVIFHQDDQEKVHNDLLSLGSDNQSCQVEARIVLKDESICDVSLSAYYSKGDNQIYCVAHDISERRKLERQKEDFLSMVGHDLRSPITSLILTFDMLMQGVLGKLNQNGEKLAATSSNDLKRLQRMINDLLDADRLEKGRMEIDIAECSSGSIKEVVLHSVSQQLEGKGVNLKSDWPAMSINCDKDRIVQVLINLIHNAIKYSEADSEIELNLQRLNGEIRIEVKDNGVGIASENLESIFDKFRQVSKKDAVEKGGSGLGLAICKALVEAHQGSIGVESELGKGSTFWIKLPC